MSLVLEFVSLNVRKPQQVDYKGKAVSTAIGKQPVKGRISLSVTHLEGDEQADKVHHGGPDQAVCVYFYDHYPHWEKVLGKTLAPGAFGENFTLRGSDEGCIRIGDTFRLGEVLLQVSHPRVPCFKLSAIHERPTLEQEVAASGYTGFYFRVLRTGTIAAGERLTLATPHPAGITVDEANRVMHRDPSDMEGLRALLAVDALSDTWRTKLLKRLSAFKQTNS
jgi:MOSC domain-containing protein YiiM